MFRRTRAAFQSLAYLITISLTTTAYCQSFDFSFESFRIRLNKRIEMNGGGLVKSCRESASKVFCSFDDKAFQQSVLAFKGLNLANGKFKLAESIQIGIKNNHVERIILVGSRADPMNLFHFIGTVGSVIGVFEPQIDAKGAAEIVTELGLMRGDSDPTIGTAQNEFRDSVAITCNQYLSALSQKVECVFVPRS